MNKMTRQELEKIHRHSSNHRAEIEASRQCGCLCCRAIFPASEVVDYIDGGHTALCPKCDTDAVIGDASGYAIKTELLCEMYKEYFDFENLPD